MDVIIKISNDAKNILDIYDVSKLLSTIPENYTINSSALKIFLNRAKLDSTVKLSLSDTSYNYLNNMAKNYNTKPNEILTYLIETVVDCGKVQTKKVAHSLDNYYLVAKMATDRTLDEKTKAVYQDLFKEILDEYAREPVLFR